jgi:hypothetical protein
MERVSFDLRQSRGLRTHIPAESAVTGSHAESVSIGLPAYRINDGTSVYGIGGIRFRGGNSNDEITECERTQ